MPVAMHQRPIMQGVFIVCVLQSSVVTASLYVSEIKPLWKINIFDNIEIQIPHFSVKSLYYFNILGVDNA